MKRLEVEKRFDEVCIKLTPVRDAVFRYLFGVNRPCSHQEILENRDVSNFNRVTVYRTLDLLLSHKLIHKILGPDGVSRFCASYPSTKNECSGNHIHFSCMECSDIFCLPEFKLPWVEAPDGCVVTSKQLMVFGKCKSCIAKVK